MKGPYRSLAGTFAQVVSRWAEETIETQAPGVVVGVADYATERCVSVQPLVMERQGDGDIIVPDIIPKALVVLQGNQDGFVSFPVKVGDKVWLGYCKRSLEEFVTSNVAEPYAPDADRVFGSSDVVVLGFVAQAGVDKPLNPDNLEINFQGSSISITPSNVISIDNGSSNVTMEGGTITANGATITSSGNVITAQGVDLNQLRADHDALYAAYILHGIDPISGPAPGHPPPPP